MNKINTKLAVASLLAMLPATASAATVSWGASTDLFQGPGNQTGAVAQSIVDTTGIFVAAFNATQGSPDSVLGATETVNGVAFTNANGATLGGGFTQGGVTITVLNPTGGNLRDTDTPYGSGSITDPNVNDLLEGGIFDSGTVTFSDLTSGQDYSIQLFNNDARGGTNNGGRDVNWQVGYSDGVTEIFDAGGVGTLGNIVATSSLNNRDVATLTGEQSGEYIIGTFTAVGTTQSFDFAGTRNGFGSFSSGTGQINALQLRNVTPVPEPSSTALLGLGGLALILRRRK